MNGNIKRILSKEELIKKVLELKKDKKRVVTTNGTFDIIHAAHLRILEKSKALGDILIVLLNSDESVRKNKGKFRPIIPENERADMLSSIRFVNYIYIFDELKPLKALEIIKPDFHVKGGSFILERVKEEKDLLESWNGKFVNFELEAGYSTTNIIEKIVSNNKK